MRSAGDTVLTSGWVGVKCRHCSIVCNNLSVSLTLAQYKFYTMCSNVSVSLTLAQYKFYTMSARVREKHFNEEETDRKTYDHSKPMITPNL